MDLSGTEFRESSTYFVDLPGEAEDEAAAAWGPLAATAASWIWRNRWLSESLNHRFLLESIDAGLVDERLTIMTTLTKLK